ncbi:MAG: aldehyde dehydrogenase family protein [Betaproteobacteria bacterium]|nr:aldehyde dehydrogenase family protein [Betaproteobacteria bacterium]
MDMKTPASPDNDPVRQQVAECVARARAAQSIYEGFTQEQVDEVVLAVGWAIMEPSRNRALAELAVADSGLGNVDDKIIKNHRKTLGLLRDLRGARSVGVISEDPARGVIEIARPVGVVGAVTPSTNPAATPANKIINALKGRNAIIVSPSPKGHGTATLLLDYIAAELRRVGAPTDLVQQLPAPVTKAATLELMRQVDMVVVTGSQSNVRSAYQSGTPAIGVGAGNVSVIVDETADLAQAANKIRRSKTFDNATSCSSENSVVIVDAVYQDMIRALQAEGGVLLDAADKQRLQQAMWPAGKLSPAITAKAAPVIARLAGLADQACAQARFLMVEETGIGHDHPFSGEKLSPVLTVYRARDFEHAQAIVREIYAYEGAGHSIGLHSARSERAMQLGLTMPACRIIVNQAHCFATGGSFDNGLPFSLSMGCGTWGGNSISDNLNYKHFLNITRIASPCTPNEPTLDDMFGGYRKRHGLG